MREGVTLDVRRAQFPSSLLMNLVNAPANTQDVDIEVTVVIDNAAPTNTKCDPGKRNGS